MPYSEMAGHCEALREGKQQKMSALMNCHQSQDNIGGVAAKDTQSHPQYESTPSKVCILPLAVMFCDINLHLRFLLFVKRELIDNKDISRVSRINSYHLSMNETIS